MSDYFAEDTIINKLGITDELELIEAEENIVAEKIIALLKESENSEPNLDYFKHIHQVLFEDLYDFAGKFRIVDIIKGDSLYPFAYAQFLQPEAERIFSELKAKNYLKRLEKPEFVVEISRLSTDLNALHPFREGNGRTIRMYLMIIAYLAGYLLDYSQVSADDIIQADKLAFEGQEYQLETMYDKITSEINDAK